MSDEVDPRYDPRFQRGYDPARHPAPKRLMEAEADVEPRSVASETADADPTPDQIRTAEAEAEVDVGELPRRNIPLFALVALAVVCLLAAVGLMARMVNREPFSDSLIRNEWDAFLEFAQSALTGPLFVGGVVALAAWIVVLHLMRGRDDG